MTCLIISASPEIDYLRLKQAAKDADYIICADGGYSYAKLCGITPNLIVGDFDSASDEIDGFHGNVIRLDVEKNETDTSVAIDKGIENGCKGYELYGCIGGRLDHTLANISLAKGLAMKGYCAALRGVAEDILFAGSGEHIIKCKTGQTVSVLACTKEVTGVTLKGMKYPLNNAVLTSTFPLGISNVAEEDNPKISIKTGFVLILVNNLNI